MSCIYVDCCDKYVDLDWDNEYYPIDINDENGKHKYTNWLCFEHLIEHIKEKHNVNEEKAEEIFEKEY